ncbi:ankyrin repeat domain-containing protein [Wolbachia pipientis]|uniref:ankyrin repeat domain-containing protein n=1 Tax=Wolbachia pipientis TaxID=955 RepID=UPI002174FC22|nr:ankyrin repeat domain-containing protein [Wolbachia pipientis]
MYQARWLMLFPKHAVDREYSFRLFTEKKSAKDFDDIVLRYEQDGKIVLRFIQVKHRQGRHKKISIGDLLTPGKNGAFGLIKYLIAYLKIKSSGEFEGEIEDFDSADSTSHPVRKLRMMPSGKNKGKEISVIRIDTQDEFLDVGDGVRYKFDNSIISYLQENKDFVKREVGREVSDKEIEDFLNKLVFAVNLPSGTELSEIIKSELGKEFSNTDASHFYSRYQEEVLILLEKEEEEFLSYEKAKALLEEIREEVLKTPIWHNVMDPIDNFVGRGDKLNAVHCGLQKSARQIIVIRGPSGVGKTEFVKKYAYDHKECYDGNVIFIDARDSKSIKESFLELAEDKRLGISATDERGSTKAIKNIVEEIYTFFAGRRSLFIFDNAEGYKGIKRFLPSSLHPRHKKPYVLITSRDCKWNVRGEGDIKVIQLDEFGEVEALEFVRKALNIENNLQDREIEELTRELQYFPLALGQAVVYIQDRNEESRLRGDKRFKISDYLKEYQQNAGELLKKGVYENEDRYTKTVLTTWNITMTYICKEYGFEALSILEIMAYLAPDNIRIKEIFSKLITDDKAKLWNTVELLNRYSMIKLREGIVNIHRLVQKVTGLNLQKEGREEEVLRKALELINSGNIVKDSTIHVASIWGYASKYGKLIDDFYFSSSYVHGEPLFIKKSAPLHFLAVSGDYEAISAIITHIERHSPGELVKTVNVKDNLGQTPLHHASYNGNLRVVEYLISKGADINVRSENDWVPLHYAPRSGVLAVVKHLISKGADVNARSKDNWVPLHLAACIGELDVVKCLINKGADVNATKPLYYGTPLHLAAYHGKLNITKCLISEGADVNARDGNNCTSVHRAAYSGKLGVVEYLISKGANVNAEDKDGNIPLHKAVQNGKLNVIKYFVGKGADVNAKNRYDWTLLHWAAYNGQLDIVRYLINKGAEINAKSWSNDTPLHLAVCSGVLDAVKCLVGKGAEVNVKSRYGGTTLCLAAMTGNVDIAKVLLKHNADVNAKNNEGKTALYYAANNNHQELVELLLAHGASYDY